MATYLCRASEDEFWAAFARSCHGSGIALSRSGAAAEATGEFVLRDSLWEIRIGTSPSNESRHTTFEIQADHTRRGKLINRGLAILGLGIFMVALGLWQVQRSPVALLLFPLGMCLLVLLLLLSAYANLRLRRLLERLLRHLHDCIGFEQATPFESRAARSYSTIIVCMATAIVCQIASLAGVVAGMLMLILSGAVLFGTVIVKPSMTGWRETLQGVQSVGVQRVAVVFMGSLLPLVLWFFLYCLVHHEQAFRNAPASTVDRAIGQVCANAWSPDASQERMSAGLIRELSLPIERIRLGVAALLVTVIVFVWGASRGIVKGLRYWQLAYLSEHPPIGPAVPSFDSLRARDSVLIGTNVLFVGAVQWGAAIVAVDTAAYLLAGRALLFPPVAWSLGLLEGLLVVAGIPVSIAFALVLVVMGTASLPGLALALTAVGRIARGTAAFLSGLMPPGRLSRDLASAHGRWLETVCAQLGVRLPHLRSGMSAEAMLASERGLIPLLPGRIVVSPDGLELLTESEVRALLAHEVYHLKHGALLISVLKGLSTLLLCPTHYLLILYDFAGHEYSADGFAARAMGGPEALRSALVKLHVASSIRRETRAPGIREACAGWLRSHSSVFRGLAVVLQRCDTRRCLPDVGGTACPSGRQWGRSGDRADMSTTTEYLRRACYELVREQFPHEAALFDHIWAAFWQTLGCQAVEDLKNGLNIASEVTPVRVLGAIGTGRQELDTLFVLGSFVNTMVSVQRACPAGQITMDVIADTLNREFVRANTPAHLRPVLFEHGLGLLAGLLGVETSTTEARTWSQTASSGWRPVCSGFARATISRRRSSRGTSIWIPLRRDFAAALTDWTWSLMSSLRLYGFHRLTGTLNGLRYFPAKCGCWG